MFNIWIALSIIFLHWVADFVLQTHEQAINKSKSNKYLLSHTFHYTMVWFNVTIYATFIFAPTYMWYGAIGKIFVFCGITFVAHTITDYFTSRLNAKLWAKGDVHNFFVAIGFDQVLHYIQLFGTYWLLTR